MRGLLHIPLLFLLAAAPLPAGAQDASAPPPLAAGAAAVDELVLQPGDVIEVQIWREAELSGPFQVGRDGTVTLPLLGTRDVANVRWEVLEERLMEEYRTELRNPSITLTPLRRVYVLGEVRQPGLYTVDPTVSVAGVVAMAGGANAQGSLDRLRVVRDGVTHYEDISVERALVSVGVRSGDQIFVGKESWFTRNSTFLVSATLSVASIIITLVR